MAVRRHSSSSGKSSVTRDMRECERAGRGRHNSSASTGLHKLRPSDPQSEGFARDIARAQEIYDAQYRRLRSTGYLQQLEQSIMHFRRSSPSPPALKRGVCLALSHVAHFAEDKDSNINTTITGLTQLAVFDTACRAFGVSRSCIKVYDPWFTEVDRAFLRKLGFDAPADEFGDNLAPKIPAVEEATLVFHPKLILPALFQANFSPKHLANIVWLNGNQRSLSTLFGRAESGGTRRWAVVDSRISAAFEPSKRSALVASSHALPNYHFHGDRNCDGLACPELTKILDDKPWKDGERRLQDYGLSSAANTLYWWPRKLLESLPAQFWQVDDRSRVRVW